MIRPFLILATSLSLLISTSWSVSSLASSSTSTADTIVIRPGSRITVFDAPVDVVCEGSAAELFIRYCKCTSVGFSKTFDLNLTLDRDGNTDVLGNFETEAACLRALKANPACGGH